ncbi:CARDB domain-containing protein [Kutzneria sp. CA-103260]|uniref:CARDB domain-containing protein n=1 Tax=Kutzneria sp. CA-103260 TaxID=2802641 RepID=UPI001BABBF0F|nr:CARDB domain-containing protein [Kutzneria sp. CA-103260]QUQ71677.1 glycosyl hydrolase [Kutzneria sp. CA-103260]
MLLRRVLPALIAAGLLIASGPAAFPAVNRAVPADATNLALGKPITASSVVGNFAASNADDGDPTTYWEAAGDSFPNTLTVSLGSNADVTSIVLRLNPSTDWGARTQTIEVLGRDQDASGFTSLVASTPYVFDPATGNTVTIPVTARVADVQLKITGNTGSGGGQISEFGVFGTPSPNPDLTITGAAWTPGTPSETDNVTVSATVQNIGQLATSASTNVGFYLGTTKVGTGQVGPLAIGASATVSANIGRHDAGPYQLTAKVDEANRIIEANEVNNSFADPTPLTISPVASSDLVATVSPTPDEPSAGDPVNFVATLRNQGTRPSAAGAHTVKATITDTYTGRLQTVLVGVRIGALAPGASATVKLGTWRAAADGRYTVKTELSNDANEVAIKRANNVSSQDLYVGRGAAMPYHTYEAENGVLRGGAAVVGPDRTIGDLAGEASGREAVTLNQTGASVEFTTKESTNTLVTRFSVPDGPASTLDVYVNGRFLKPVTLDPKYVWLYGPEASPSNDPAAGPARHIYDEANLLLGTTVPAGSKIRLQKDAANTGTFAIDFVSLELATLVANPDPAHLVTPAGFTQQDVQAALDKVRADITGAYTGVYLPAGDYRTTDKFTVTGSAVKIVGAGPWFTRFLAPQDKKNVDVGFRIDSSANGSSFAGFSYFGDYDTRLDGQGRVFDLANVSDLSIDNVWVEHSVVMVWGTNVHNLAVSNSRARDLMADGINLTNGSTGNHVVNDEARSTGDDSFALWAATDLHNGDQRDNLFEHLTALTPWRAAGVAVYGGQANSFQDVVVADTLAGSGVTISSLNFGVTMRDFGPDTTALHNFSVVRSGGHFWGAQTFPAIWVFSATNKFQAIRVSDVDIVDPTYSGIMFQTDYVNGQAAYPIADTEFDRVTISGAHLSGDAFQAKSGFGLWANELPEPGQGPAVGSVTFHGLRLCDNAQDVKNTTATFKINIE